MRIVIADDHEIVRIGLRAVLQECAEGYEIVGEAQHGDELMALLATHECDVLIHAFAMAADPYSNSMALLHALREAYPALPIIILTVRGNPALFRAMYTAGATAVIGKTAMVRELIDALRAVRHGRAYLGRPTSSKLSNRHGWGGVKLPVKGQMALPLSARETEVVRMLTQGMSVSGIARGTDLSIKTISQQKRDAMRKLGISSESHLHEYARLMGI